MIDNLLDIPRWVISTLFPYEQTQKNGPKTFVNTLRQSNLVTDLIHRMCVVSYLQQRRGPFWSIKTDPYVSLNHSHKI